MVQYLFKAARPGKGSPARQKAARPGKRQPGPAMKIRFSKRLKEN